MPFFSIIIPTRNEEKRLGYCLPSLLNQTFQDFEIIIVEDPGTNDKTKEFVGSLKSDKIKYIYHPEGYRVPAKRNFGAKEAVGEYIYMIDADMEFPKDTLKILHDQIINSKSEIVFVKELTPGKDWLSKMKNFEKQIIQNETSICAARLFKMSLYNEIGGYNEDLIAGEEMDFSDRALAKSHKYIFSDCHIHHFETSGASLVQHLKKKFKYGITVNQYFKAKEQDVDDDKKVSEKRAGASRLIYFTSPLNFQNPILGIQFVVFKFVEMSILATGMIYGKFFKKNIVNTK